jgi:hypothetical protein
MLDVPFRNPKRVSARRIDTPAPIRILTVAPDHPIRSSPLSFQHSIENVISNFRHGKYLVFDLTGPILITINSGSYPNAVLSGIFSN